MKKVELADKTAKAPKKSNWPYKLVKWSGGFAVFVEKKPPRVRKEANEGEEK